MAFTVSNPKIYPFLGAFLIFLVLAIEGLPVFPKTIEHLKEDFGPDLLIHVFIAGCMLAAYGIFLSVKRRSK